MIVRFHEPRRLDGTRYEVFWPEDWPPPRVGEVIMSTDGHPLEVKSVTWHPYGDTPYAYVVLRYQDLGGAR